MKKSTRFLLTAIGIFVLLQWSMGKWVVHRNPKKIPADTCPGKTYCIGIYLAPWCPHCRSHTGRVQRILQWSRAGNIGAKVVVGKDQRDRLASYASTISAQPVLLDDDEAIAKAWGVAGVPGYFVFDKEGSKILEGHEARSWVDERVSKISLSNLY